MNIKSANIFYIAIALICAALIDNGVHILGALMTLTVVFGFRTWIKSLFTI